MTDQEFIAHFYGLTEAWKDSFKIKMQKIQREFDDELKKINDEFKTKMLVEKKELGK